MVFLAVGAEPDWPAALRVNKAGLQKANTLQWSSTAAYAYSSLNMREHAAWNAVYSVNN